MELSEKIIELLKSSEALKGGEIAEKLGVEKSEVDKILKKYKPEFMAIEDLFYFKNNKTVISVAQARGVILLAGFLGTLLFHNKKLLN